MKRRLKAPKTNNADASGSDADPSKPKSANDSSSVPPSSFVFMAFVAFAFFMAFMAFKTILYIRLKAPKF
jgi:hypothetical protein